MSRFIKKFEPKTQFQANILKIMDMLKKLHGDHYFVVAGFPVPPPGDTPEYLEHGLVTNLRDSKMLAEYLRLVSEGAAKGTLGETICGEPLNPMEIN